MHNEMNKWREREREREQNKAQKDKNKTSQLLLLLFALVVALLDDSWLVETFHFGAFVLAGRSSAGNPRGLTDFVVLLLFIFNEDYSRFQLFSAMAPTSRSHSVCFDIMGGQHTMQGCCALNRSRETNVKDLGNIFNDSVKNFAVFNMLIYN